MAEKPKPHDIHGCVAFADERELKYYWVWSAGSSAMAEVSKCLLGIIIASDDEEAVRKARREWPRAKGHMELEPSSPD